MSDMQTSAVLIAPPATAFTAALMALVPLRRQLPKSRVWVSGSHCNTAAIRAAPCFSLYGAVVVAKYRASIWGDEVLPRQSREAATAMVRLSSSKLATALSPAEPPVCHAPAIMALDS